MPRRAVRDGGSRSRSRQPRQQPLSGLRQGSNARRHQESIGRRGSAGWGRSDAAVAAEPAIFEINGWRVAVVGFGGVRPHDGWIATEDQAGMADGDTIESMVATVEAAGRWPISWL